MNEKRKQKILTVKKESDLPSKEQLFILSRDTILTLVFTNDKNGLREKVGHKWKSEFPQLLIGVPNQNPEINISKLISDEEIVDNQDFLEKCAKDYRELAIRLINEFTNFLNVQVNPKSPLETFNVFKRSGQKSYGIMNEWRYSIHGFHCGFEHLQNGQKIEVTLVNGLEFGALDPYFFTRFIRSTSEYFPLPISIYEDYHDGVRILEVMESIGKFEKVNSIFSNRQDIVVTSRDKIEVNTYESEIPN